MSAQRLLRHEQAEEVIQWSFLSRRQTGNERPLGALGC
jgi:hypothetical protein